MVESSVFLKGLIMTICIDPFFEKFEVKTFSKVLKFNFERKEQLISEFKNLMIL